MADLRQLHRDLDDLPKTGAPMPALFVGHGNPMNAIEDNEFSRAWAEEARRLPVPAAVLCISAHWQTAGTRVTAMARPRTIHDFYGFPPELFRQEYPAPGAPEWAAATAAAITTTAVTLDHEWGLDHGTWSVLKHMYPQADVPVYQLSIDATRSAEYHYELGRELAVLRRRGVLIVGSGNIVHNLRLMQWTEEAYDWAQAFDEDVRKRILQGDHASLIRYQDLGAAAALAVPTPDHYHPLLYVLGLQERRDGVRFFSEKTTAGSISMRGLRLG